MFFFLFFHFFPLILGDCLEFPNNTESINECLIINQTITLDLDLENDYPECLRCHIQTMIKSANIQYEEDNKCSSIDLQCIQLIFNTKEIFEDFFQNHQQLIFDLFSRENGTDRNTLHIIIKENTFDEINSDYMEKIFQFDYQSYRVLFFEVYQQNAKLKINRNLINITRLAIKLILDCGDEINPIQTIYIIHNGKFILESEQDFCSINSIPSTATSTFESTTTIQTSSSILLSISQEKSKDIVLIIVILTGLFLFLLMTFIICCLKWIRHRRHRRRLSKKNETTSELSMSQDISIETPLALPQKPQLSLKPKRPLRGMRAIQLLDDDI